MPLWNIWHPPGAFDAEQKKAFSADITAWYGRYGLPAFYVVVVFEEVEPESLLVGGEPTDALVRFRIDHVARETTSAEQRYRASESLSALIAPHVHSRGFTHEFHVAESSRDFWMVDGVWAPPGGSEAEQLWARENRPVPYAAAT